MFRKKWQPAKWQKDAYAARMRAIETAKSEPIPPAYSINCTGDCVTGDQIAFFNPNKEGERQYGAIVSDSYGAQKQQHTFTIELLNGEKNMIKGRNLYKNGVYRQPWPDESARLQVLEQKHERGDLARQAKEARKRAKLEKQLYGSDFDLAD